MHKINFENATDRRTVKEHMLLTPNDGQVKHPEHLREHEMMVNIQRLALNGEEEKVKESLLEWPEDKRKDLRKILIDSVVSQGRTINI